MGKRTQTSFKPTHGKTRVGGWRGPIDPTYLTWQRMKSRCLNPNAPDFSHYGGRGITVCDRWKNSFGNFLSDMGPRTRDQQIDRIDNNGNYELGNCRWVSKKVNASNRRTSLSVTVNGVTHSGTEWDEIMGLPANTVSARMKRGWSADKAVNTPLQRG